MASGTFLESDLLSIQVNSGTRKATSLKPEIRFRRSRSIRRIVRYPTRSGASLLAPLAIVQLGFPAINCRRT